MWAARFFLHWDFTISNRKPSRLRFAELLAFVAVGRIQKPDAGRVSFNLPSGVFGFRGRLRLVRFLAVLVALVRWNNEPHLLTPCLPDAIFRSDTDGL